MKISKPSDLAKALKMPYAWPGGYPTYFITDDGAALCHSCVKRQAANHVIPAIRDKSRDGWRVVACDVNYEDSSLICEHCGETIESAYTK